MIDPAARKELQDLLNADQLDAFDAALDHLRRRGFAVTIGRPDNGSVRERVELAIAAWCPQIGTPTRDLVVEAVMCALPERDAP